MQNIKKKIPLLVICIGMHMYTGLVYGLASRTMRFIIPAGIAGAGVYMSVDQKEPIATVGNAIWLTQSVVNQMNESSKKARDLHDSLCTSAAGLATNIFGRSIDPSAMSPYVIAGAAGVTALGVAGGRFMMQKMPRIPGVCAVKSVVRVPLPIRALSTVGLAATLGYAGSSYAQGQFARAVQPVLKRLDVLEGRIIDEIGEVQNLIEARYLDTITQFNDALSRTQTLLADRINTTIAAVEHLQNSFESFRSTISQEIADQVATRIEEAFKGLHEWQVTATQSIDAITIKVNKVSAKIGAISSDLAKIKESMGAGFEKVGQDLALLQSALLRTQETAEATNAAVQKIEKTVTESTARLGEQNLDIQAALSGMNLSLQEGQKSLQEGQEAQDEKLKTLQEEIKKIREQQVEANNSQCEAFAKLAAQNEELSAQNAAFSALVQELVGKVGKLTGSADK